MNGIYIVLKERTDQIHSFGYDAEYDGDFNDKGELKLVASELLKESPDIKNFPKHWNGERIIKLIEKPFYERIAIAGAFCIAELDRLDFIGELRGTKYE